LIGATFIPPVSIARVAVSRSTALKLRFSILTSQGSPEVGDETQAIAGWNSPGPIHIVNNYLEGAGEVILIGGADPSIVNLVPSDLEISRNYLRKPKEWLGRAGIKGTLELKNARRVNIEGNLIESEILTTAIVLTVRNQNGKAPWSTLEDVTVRNNLVRHASSGINILGSDNEHRSQEAKRIRVVNNLLLDIVQDRPDNIPYFPASQWRPTNRRHPQHSPAGRQRHYRLWSAEHWLCFSRQHCSVQSIRNCVFELRFRMWPRILFL
jgi:hypothetical protein